MKKFITIKTYKKDAYPDVIAVKDTMTEAMEAILEDVVKRNSSFTLGEIEEELNEYGHFDYYDDRYTISKYWE